MKQQKRYTSEEQIVASIERLHELERIDLFHMDSHKQAIRVLRVYPDKSEDVNFHKGKVDELEKKIGRRGTRIERMKQKLAEFRTMVLPGMGEAMPDNSIVR